MANEADLTTVVIDTGSGWVKAGRPGAAPELVFRNVIGRRADGTGVPVVGDEAWRRRGELTLSFPVEHGAVTDWDGIAIVWWHAFERLGLLSAVALFPMMGGLSTSLFPIPNSPNWPWVRR
ncbi:hypothetical protein, partial [Streptomyces lavendulae]